MKLVLPEEEAKVPMEEEEEVVKKEKNMEVVKEKEYGPREGVSSSGSPIFTLRNSQTGASTPPPKPQAPWPDAPEEVCILQDASTQHQSKSSGEGAVVRAEQGGCSLSKLCSLSSEVCLCQGCSVRRRPTPGLQRRTS